MERKETLNIELSVSPELRLVLFFVVAFIMISLCLHLNEKYNINRFKPNTIYTINYFDGYENTFAIAYGQDIDIIGDGVKLKNYMGRDLIIPYYNSIVEQRLENNETTGDFYIKTKEEKNAKFKKDEHRPANKKNSK